MTSPRGGKTTDISTAPLRRFLRGLGYDAHAWQLGRNLGPKAIGREGEKLKEFLLQRVAQIEALCTTVAPPSGSPATSATRAHSWRTARILASVMNWSSSAASRKLI